jgi:N-acetylmuramoyl-L-alanine amidase
MKLTGFALALALAVGLTGFNLRTRPQIPEPLESSSALTSPAGSDVIHETPLEMAGVAGPTRLVPVGEIRTPPPQEATPIRSSRRRGGDRYPGPIPTPEEWEPPEGPVRIALQAGHWKADEAPREISGIRSNGARWEGMLEWEANLEIAERAGALLEELGYEVDILPAVVPPGYRAHLFISIHADGSNDPHSSGYRIAAPRRDATGRAAAFVELLEESYGEETGLPRLPTVTHRMQNYYAFNFRRYEHALHPMTIGVIIETGFLTNPGDRRVIVEDPERAARGIVEAVKAYPQTPPPADATSRGPGVRHP